MLIVGLTGSIGMGKSTVAQRFRAHGIAVCDADAVVHELYATTAVARIAAAFPGTVNNGVVDRTMLAAALLKDPAGFKRLEGIVHPLVQAREREFLRLRFQCGDKIAVLEIPLLFETGGDTKVDVTMVVSAPADMQRARVLARPGMTEQKFAEILKRQLPDAEKRLRATFVVDTGQSIEHSGAQVDTLIQELSTRTGRAFALHWA